MPRKTSFLLVLIVCPATVGAQPSTGTPEDAATIMAKVTANVEKAEEARRFYVYRQHVRSSLIRTSGEISRREKREYSAVPTDTRTRKQLVSFEGEYRIGKEMIPYSKPGFQYKDTDIDGDLIDDLTDDLVNDKSARDGIPHSLFPLLTKDLRLYRFTMQGQTKVGDRPAWQIAFEPIKGKDSEEHGEMRPWRGEIWVDTEEFQPVRIQTQLAFRIPWGVRVFLGTNLRQTGFSLTYRRVADNVWFPATYGTEFRVDALWFYKRTIVLSMENSDFQKTDVDSTVRYALPAQ